RPTSLIHPNPLHALLIDVAQLIQIGTQRSKSPESVLRMYLENPSAETLAGAQDALRTLASLRPYLDQLRYI
ncbi:hypothetical protein, partial [Aeromonas caviae]|uniref:hypothetical protein n=1 Tax=Aeromonas caviae TaxID=648 RepID=UPI001CC765C1